ncbi:MAG: SDR family NAD(P)-dependent oxidoreductase, partial [Leptospiraceae bacterium]|nr:SDR family NAD(P)-dependent oxidoreductase [Leptospiraceae bacterium]
MQKQAVLITGGGIRLGRAIALSLAEKGIDIALHYNSSKIEAEETARIIRSLGIDCELFPLNLKDISSFQSYIEKVKYRFPHLHILINSASSYTQKSIKDTDEKTFDEQFQINLKAPFFLSQAFYKVIDKGNIIN